MFGDWLREFGAGVLEDFSDLPSVGQAMRIAVRLLLAALLGGLIGYQREKIGKEAGLRTHMLVALGAAFFILVAQQAGIPREEYSRIIQGIISGIGFLGAGAILKQAEQGQITGLTTASGIWLTAAIGTAAGLGLEASAVLCAVLAYAILASVVLWERRGRKNEPADTSTPKP